jgi:hypothetical protein
MTNCPICDSKVVTDDKTGLFGTKNRFISEEQLKRINDILPKELQSEQICQNCLKPEFTTGTLAKKMVDLRDKLFERNKDIEKIKSEKLMSLRRSAMKTVKILSTIPSQFVSKQYIYSIIMFDSGTRSTSADNLEAGAWNIIHDNLTLKLGNSEKVEKALQSALAELQLKCISLNCDTVTAITPTYSDLAANGKILLHLSGTAGFIEKSNIKDSDGEIIRTLEEIENESKNNSISIMELEALWKEMEKGKFKS